ncbi:MAG: hypothetical protein GXO99_06665 [Nitrospirae bacterium]|nr:hypothetical protein [Nitrospirota bacterium]
MIFVVQVNASILLDRIVAVIGRDVITWSELYKSMEFEFSDRLEGMSPEEKREFLKRYEKDYLDRMIDMKVQLKEAEKLNLTVSDSEIEQAIKSIQKKYSLTPEQFRKAIQQQGFTMKEYRKKLAEQILLNKVQSYKIAGEIFISEKEIDDYIKRHPEEFKTREGYSFRQILLRVRDESERTAAENAAQRIMELLKKGEPFDRVAERFIKAPPAFMGKEVIFVDRNDLSETLKKVLDSLKPGTYSEPFWTDSGLVILYLQNKMTLKESIREIARERLRQEKFNKKLKEWVRSLRSKYYIEVKIHS